MQNVRSGIVAGSSRVATKDTYAEEDVGGLKVRRFVSSGDPIPDHYTVADDTAYEDATSENIDQTSGG